MKIRLRPSSAICRKVTKSSSTSLGVSNRRGFVQHQYAGVPVKGLDDFHPLPFAHGQLPDVGGGVHLEAETLRQFPDPSGNGLQIGQGSPGGGESQGHIFGDRQRGHQHEMLVDHADTVGYGIRRRGQPNGPAIQANLSGIGLVETVKDLHQGALAGPVLPEKRVDFSRHQVEIHPIVGNHARKGFSDGAHFKNGSGAFTHDRHVFCLSINPRG